MNDTTTDESDYCTCAIELFWPVESTICEKHICWLQGCVGDNRGNPVNPLYLEYSNLPVHTGTSSGIYYPPLKGNLS